MARSERASAPISLAQSCRKSAQVTKHAPTFSELPLQWHITSLALVLFWFTDVFSVLMEACQGEVDNLFSLSLSLHLAL
jgi:hypothetical protein